MCGILFCKLTAAALAIATCHRSLASEYSFRLYLNMITFAGKATARTHVSQYVVNKATKYEKSSGLEEVVDRSVAVKLASPALLGTATLMN